MLLKILPYALTLIFCNLAHAGLKIEEQNIDEETPCDRWLREYKEVKNLFTKDYKDRAIKVINPGRCYAEAGWMELNVEVVDPQNLMYSLKQFQLEEVCDDEVESFQNFTLKSTPSKLTSYNWTNLCVQGNKGFISLKLPEKNLKRMRHVFYRLYGRYSPHDSPEALAGLRIAPMPTSIKDFLTLYKLKSNDELKLELEKIVKENKGWARNIDVKIRPDGDKIKYRLDSLLGSGQDGCVFKASAVDKNGKDPEVAIKVFTTIDCDPNEDNKARKEMEARKHFPHKVAKIYGEGLQKVSGVKALVMEHIDAPTLYEFITNYKGRMPYKEAWTLIKDLFKVLYCVNLYDFTTDNVMVIRCKSTQDIALKFIDFAKWDYGSTLSGARNQEKIKNLIHFISQKLNEEDREKFMSDLNQEYADFK